MTNAFTHTDENDHRVTVRRHATATGAPVVAVEAEDLAIGGTITTVWLDLPDAADLADVIDARRPAEFTDRSGDTITTAPLAACTTVLVTEYPGDEVDEEQPRTVAVVVPTHDLAALAAAIRATVTVATAREAAEEQPRPADNVEERTAILDGRDALAFVIIRPGDTPDTITVEAGSRGLSKADAARVLREVARQWSPEPTPPAVEEPAVPAVGDRYVSRHVNRIVTVTRVWTAEDGHTAVAYEWRDDRPGQCGSACPLTVFRREYRPATSPARP